MVDAACEAGISGRSEGRSHCCVIWLYKGERRDQRLVEAGAEEGEGRREWANSLEVAVLVACWRGAGSCSAGGGAAAHFELVVADWRACKSGRDGEVELWVRRVQLAVYGRGAHRQRAIHVQRSCSSKLRAPGAVDDGGRAFNLSST